jgi:hypothetical protein
MAEINITEALLLVLHNISGAHFNDAELEFVREAEKVLEDYARGTLDRLLAEKQNAHRPEGFRFPFPFDPMGKRRR